MTSYSVSDVNRFIKQILLAEDILHRIAIRGEVSNFVHHLRSGHCYFTLKDQNSALKCVMFKSNVAHLRFMPENGMQVIALGDIQVFERDGVYQLYCTDIQPDGAGALAMAFEQLKQKLAKEGLFDPERKKPLPAQPNTIGVVTSKTGAALQDILQILSRRYPIGTVKIFPAQVQGEQAAGSICSAIRLAEQVGVDVLIVGRGGGSLEDLWAFNEEAVARAIAACSIPVISAVGHEVDFTIADFVADLRAPTPSAAAELVAPDLQYLLSGIDKQRELLYNYTVDCIQQREHQLVGLEHQLHLHSPAGHLAAGQAILHQLDHRLETCFQSSYSQAQQRFGSAVSLLENLSPLKVLGRGYSITFNEEHKAVKNSRRLKIGDTLTTKFYDGSMVESTITKKMR
ncbi:exodeoxyribonuclease VII large subunit [Clostridium facile]|uniref:Exodeoxyribonuclease 7 large subunit n=1 Tax=Clostridium facile TaxID=2763035 RepID=A0ABR7IQ97_9CLOT|nr:exodeoxyribonuclease VII large subunit [Clostridium facile]